jgi:hypothetical protein
MRVMTMWQKVNGALLAVLVLISAVLSEGIRTSMYQPPELRAPALPVSSAPAPADLLMPWEVFWHTPANASDDHFRVGMQDESLYAAWQFWRGVTGKNGAVPVEPLASNASVYQTALLDGGLELRLFGPVELRFWLEGLRVQPNSLPAGTAMFTRLFIPDGGTIVYLYNEFTGQAWSWTGWDIPVSQLATLGQDITEHGIPYLSLAGIPGLQVGPGVYVPAQRLRPGGEPYVTTEVGRANEIVASFFSDMSIVRRLVNVGGVVTYTDNGMRGVTVDTGKSPFKGAAFEFAEPPAGQDSQDLWTVSGALFEDAINFVAEHGGWPTDSRLSQVEQSSADGQPALQMKFNNFVNGWPLFDESDNLTVTLSNQGVHHYYRHLYVPVAGERNAWTNLYAMPAERALRSIDWANNDQMLVNIHIGYYMRSELNVPNDPKGEALQPVWVFVLRDGRRLWVNPAWDPQGQNP